MKKLLKITTFCIIIFLLFISINCYAGTIEKLGRGISNTATGWVELPVAVKENCDVHGVVGGVLYGIPIGITKTVLRTAVGIYETLTFPFPIPEDYAPILEPEFVIGSDFEPVR